MHVPHIPYIPPPAQPVSGVIADPAGPAGPVPPEHFAAISLSAAAVCLVVAQLLRWKRLRRLEGATPWLYLLAGLGLSAPFLRGLVHTAADLGRSVPGLGSAIAVSLGIAALFIFCYDVWPKHRTNGLTAISALMLPALAPEIGGAIGSGLASALDAVAVGGARAISALIGV